MKNEDTVKYHGVIRQIGLWEAQIEGPDIRHLRYDMYMHTRPCRTWEDELELYNQSCSLSGIPYQMRRNLERGTEPEGASGIANYYMNSEGDGYDRRSSGLHSIDNHRIMSARIDKRGCDIVKAALMRKPRFRLDYDQSEINYPRAVTFDEMNF